MFEVPTGVVLETVGAVTAAVVETDGAVLPDTVDGRTVATVGTVLVVVVVEEVLDDWICTSPVGALKAIKSR